MRPSAGATLGKTDWHRQFETDETGLVPRRGTVHVRGPFEVRRVHGAWRVIHKPTKSETTAGFALRRLKPALAFVESLDGLIDWAGLDSAKIEALAKTTAWHELRQKVTALSIAASTWQGSVPVDAASLKAKAESIVEETLERSARFARDLADKGFDRLGMEREAREGLLSTPMGRLGIGSDGRAMIFTHGGLGRLGMPLEVVFDSVSLALGADKAASPAQSGAPRAQDRVSGVSRAVHSALRAKSRGDREMTSRETRNAARAARKLLNAFLAEREEGKVPTAGVDLGKLVQGLRGKSVHPALAETARAYAADVMAVDDDSRTAANEALKSAFGRLGILAGKDDGQREDFEIVPTPLPPVEPPDIQPAVGEVMAPVWSKDTVYVPVFEPSWLEVGSPGLFKMAQRRVGVWNVLSLPAEVNGALGVARAIQETGSGIRKADGWAIYHRSTGLPLIDRLFATPSDAKDAAERIAPLWEWHLLTYERDRLDDPAAVASLEKAGAIADRVRVLSRIRREIDRLSDQARRLEREMAPLSALRVYSLGDAADRAPAEATDADWRAAWQDLQKSLRAAGLFPAFPIRNSGAPAWSWRIASDRTFDSFVGEAWLERENGTWKAVVGEYPAPAARRERPSLKAPGVPFSDKRIMRAAEAVTAMGQPATSKDPREAEPWKMPRRRWLAERGGLGLTEKSRVLKSEHADSVIDAMGRGDAVPAEVLKDYPSLRSLVEVTGIMSGSGERTVPINDPPENGYAWHLDDWVRLAVPTAHGWADAWPVKAWRYGDFMVHRPVAWPYGERLVFPDSVSSEELIARMEEMLGDWRTASIDDPPDWAIDGAGRPAAALRAPSEKEAAVLEERRTHLTNALSGTIAAAKDGLPVDSSAAFHFGKPEILLYKDAAFADLRRRIGSMRLEDGPRMKKSGWMISHAGTGLPMFDETRALTRLEDAKAIVERYDRYYDWSSVTFENLPALSRDADWRKARDGFSAAAKAFVDVKRRKRELQRVEAAAKTTREAFVKAYDSLRAAKNRRHSLVGYSLGGEVDMRPSGRGDVEESSRPADPLSAESDIAPRSSGRVNDLSRPSGRGDDLLSLTSETGRNLMRLAELGVARERLADMLDIAGAHPDHVAYMRGDLVVTGPRLERGGDSIATDPRPGARRAHDTCERIGTDPGFADFRRMVIGDRLEIVLEEAAEGIVTSRVPLSEITFTLMPGVTAEPGALGIEPMAVYVLAAAWTKARREHLPDESVEAAFDRLLVESGWQVRLPKISERALRAFGRDPNAAASPVARAYLSMGSWIRREVVADGSKTDRETTINDLSRPSGRDDDPIGLPSAPPFALVRSAERTPSSRPESHEENSMGNDVKIDSLLPDISAVKAVSFSLGQDTPSSEDDADLDRATAILMADARESNPVGMADPNTVRVLFLFTTDEGSRGGVIGVPMEVLTASTRELKALSPEAWTSFLNNLRADSSRAAAAISMASPIEPAAAERFKKLVTLQLSASIVGGEAAARLAMPDEFNAVFAVPHESPDGRLLPVLSLEVLGEVAHPDVVDLLAGEREDGGPRLFARRATTTSHSLGADAEPREEKAALRAERSDFASALKQKLRYFVAEGAVYAHPLFAETFGQTLRTLGVAEHARRTPKDQILTYLALSKTPLSKTARKHLRDGLMDAFEKAREAVLDEHMKRVFVEADARAAYSLGAEDGAALLARLPDGLDRSERSLGGKVLMGTGAALAVGTAAVPPLAVEFLSRASSPAPDMSDIAFAKAETSATALPATADVAATVGGATGETGMTAADVAQMKLQMFMTNAAFKIDDLVRRQVQMLSSAAGELKRRAGDGWLGDVLGNVEAFSKEMAQFPSPTAFLGEVIGELPREAWRGFEDAVHRGAETLGLDPASVVEKTIDAVSVYGGAVFSLGEDGETARASRDGNADSFAALLENRIAELPGEVPFGMNPAEWEPISRAKQEALSWALEMLPDDHGDMPLSRLADFDQAVMLAVLDEGKNAHGATVWDRAAARLGRNITLGGVYAAIDRLEKSGLVRTWRGDGDESRSGRAKRMMAVTNRGLRALHAVESRPKPLWANVDLPGPWDFTQFVALVEKRIAELPGAVEFPLSPDRWAPLARAKQESLSWVIEMLPERVQITPALSLGAVADPAIRDAAFYLDSAVGLNSRDVVDQAGRVGVEIVRGASSTVPADKPVHAAGLASRFVRAVGGVFGRRSPPPLTADDVKRLMGAMTAADRETILKAFSSPGAALSLGASDETLKGIAAAFNGARELNLSFLQEWRPTAAQDRAHERARRVLAAESAVRARRAEAGTDNLTLYDAALARLSTPAAVARLGFGDAAAVDRDGLARSLQRLGILAHRERSYMSDIRRAVAAASALGVPSAFDLGAMSLAMTLPNIAAGAEAEVAGRRLRALLDGSAIKNEALGYVEEVFGAALRDMPAEIRDNVLEGPLAHRGAVALALEAMANREPSPFDVGTVSGEKLDAEVGAWGSLRPGVHEAPLVSLSLGDMESPAERLTSLEADCRNRLGTDVAGALSEYDTMIAMGNNGPEGAARVRMVFYRNGVDLNGFGDAPIGEERRRWILAYLKGEASAVYSLGDEAGPAELRARSDKKGMRAAGRAWWQAKDAFTPFPVDASNYRVSVSLPEGLDRDALLRIQNLGGYDNVVENRAGDVVRTMTFAYRALEDAIAAHGSLSRSELVHSAGMIVASPADDWRVGANGFETVSPEGRPGSRDAKQSPYGVPPDTLMVARIVGVDEENARLRFERLAGMASETETGEGYRFLFRRAGLYLFDKAGRDGKARGFVLVGRDGSVKLIDRTEANDLARRIELQSVQSTVTGNAMNAAAAVFEAERAVVSLLETSGVSVSQLKTAFENVDKAVSRLAHAVEATAVSHPIVPAARHFLAASEGLRAQLRKTGLHPHTYWAEPSARTPSIRRLEAIRHERLKDLAAAVDSGRHAVLRASRAPARANISPPRVGRARQGTPTPVAAKSLALGAVADLVRAPAGLPPIGLGRAGTRELMVGKRRVEDIDAFQGELARIARTINPDVDVQFVEKLYAEGNNLIASGAASAAKREVSGMMEHGAGARGAGRATINLGYENHDPINSSAHESWHSIESLLTEKEQAVLRKAYPGSHDVAAALQGLPKVVRARLALAFGDPDAALAGLAPQRRLSLLQGAGGDARKALETLPVLESVQLLIEHGNAANEIGRKYSRWADGRDRIRVKGIRSDMERLEREIAKPSKAAIAYRSGLDGAPERMTHKERVAYAFGAYAARRWEKEHPGEYPLAGTHDDVRPGEPADPAVRGIFGKFYGFFERAQNWLEGNGFQNASDVYDRAWKGRIGQRRPLPEGWWKKAFKPAAAKATPATLLAPAGLEVGGLGRPARSFAVSDTREFFRMDEATETAEAGTAFRERTDYEAAAASLRDALAEPGVAAVLRREDPSVGNYVVHLRDTVSVVRHTGTETYAAEFREGIARLAMDAAEALRAVAAGDEAGMPGLRANALDHERLIEAGAGYLSMDAQLQRAAARGLDTYVVPPQPEFDYNRAAAVGVAGLTAPETIADAAGMAKWLADTQPAYMGNWVERTGTQAFENLPLLYAAVHDIASAPKDPQEARDMAGMAHEAWYKNAFAHPDNDRWYVPPAGQVAADMESALAATNLDDETRVRFEGLTKPLAVALDHVPTLTRTLERIHQGGEPVPAHVLAAAALGHAGNPDGTVRDGEAFLLEKIRREGERVQNRMAAAVSEARLQFGAEDPAVVEMGAGIERMIELRNNFYGHDQSTREGRLGAMMNMEEYSLIADTVTGRLKSLKASKEFEALTEDQRRDLEASIAEAVESEAIREKSTAAMEQVAREFEAERNDLVRRYEAADPDGADADAIRREGDELTSRMIARVRELGFTVREVEIAGDEVMLDGVSIGRKADIELESVQPMLSSLDERGLFRAEAVIHGVDTAKWIMERFASKYPLEQAGAEKAHATLDAAGDLYAALHVARDRLDEGDSAAAAAALRTVLERIDSSDMRFPSGRDAASEFAFMLRKGPIAGGKRRAATRDLWPFLHAIDRIPDMIAAARAASAETVNPGAVRHMVDRVLSWAGDPEGGLVDRRDKNDMQWVEFHWARMIAEMDAIAGRDESARFASAPPKSYSLGSDGAEDDRRRALPAFAGTARNTAFGAHAEGLAESTRTEGRESMRYAPPVHDYEQRLAEIEAAAPALHGMGWRVGDTLVAGLDVPRSWPALVRDDIPMVLVTDTVHGAWTVKADFASSPFQIAFPTAAHAARAAESLAAAFDWRGDADRLRTDRALRSEALGAAERILRTEASAAATEQRESAMADPSAAVDGLRAAGFDVAAPGWMVVTDGSTPEIRQSLSNRFPMVFVYGSRESAAEVGRTNVAPVYARKGRTADLTMPSGDPDTEASLKKFWAMRERDIKARLYRHILAEEESRYYRNDSPYGSAGELQVAAEAKAAELDYARFAGIVETSKWEDLAGDFGDDLVHPLLDHFMADGFDSVVYRERPGVEPRTVVFSYGNVSLAWDRLRASIEAATAEAAEKERRHGEWLRRHDQEARARLSEERAAAIRDFDIADLRSRGFDVGAPAWHGVENPDLPDLDPFVTPGGETLHVLYPSRDDAVSGSEILYGEPRDAVRVYVRPGQAADLSAPAPAEVGVLRSWYDSGRNAELLTRAGVASFDGFADLVAKGQWRRLGGHGQEVWNVLVEAFQRHDFDTLKVRDPRGVPVVIAFNDRNLSIAWNLEEGRDLARVSVLPNGRPAIGVGLRSAALLGLGSPEELERLRGLDEMRRIAHDPRQENAAELGRISVSALDLAAEVRLAVDPGAVVFLRDGDDFRAYDGDARRAAALDEKLSVVEMTTKAGTQADVTIPEAVAHAVGERLSAKGAVVVLAAIGEDGVLETMRYENGQGRAVNYTAEDLAARRVTADARLREHASLRSQADRYEDISIAARRDEIPAIAGEDGKLHLYGARAQDAASVSTLLRDRGGEIVPDRGARNEVEGSEGNTIAHVSFGADELEQVARDLDSAALKLVLADGVDRGRWTFVAPPADTARRMGFTAGDMPSRDGDNPEDISWAAADRYATALSTLPQGTLGLVREGGEPRSGARPAGGGPIDARAGARDAHGEDLLVAYGPPATAAADLSRLLKQHLEPGIDGRPARLAFPAWLAGDVAREISAVAGLAELKADGTWRPLAASGAEVDDRGPSRVPPEAGPITPARERGTESAIPFMITAAMREALNRRGFTAEQIRSMTPAEAHRRLGTGPSSPGMQRAAGFAGAREAVSAGERSPGLESWQVPRDAWGAAAAARAGSQPRDRTAAYERAAAEHRTAVLLAVEEGKPVPAEVLRDYRPQDVGIARPTAEQLARFGFSVPAYIAGDISRVPAIASDSPEKAASRGGSVTAVLIRPGRTATLKPNPDIEVKRALATVFTEAGSRLGFAGYRDFEAAVTAGRMRPEALQAVLSGLQRAGFEQAGFVDATGNLSLAVLRSGDVVVAPDQGAQRIDSPDQGVQIDTPSALSPSVSHVDVSAVRAAVEADLPAGRVEIGVPRADRPYIGAAGAQPKVKGDAAMAIAPSNDAGHDSLPASAGTARRTVGARSDNNNMGNAAAEWGADSPPERRLEFRLAGLQDALNALPRETADADVLQRARAAAAADGEPAPSGDLTVPRINELLYEDIERIAPGVLPFSSGYVMFRDPTVGGSFRTLSMTAFISAIGPEGYIGTSAKGRKAFPPALIDRLKDFSGIYAETTDAAFADELRKVKDDVARIAREVNPNVTMKLVGRLFGEGDSVTDSSASDRARQPVAGLYFRAHNLAAVTTDVSRGDPVVSAYHELFHPLFELLTAEEKAILEVRLSGFERDQEKRDRAKFDGDIKAVEGEIAKVRGKASSSVAVDPRVTTLEERLAWLQKRKDEVSYGQGSTEDRMAEMFAQIAAAKFKGERIGGRRAGLFGSIDKFRERWANSLKGHGWQTFEDVIERARTGKIAARSRVFDVTGRIDAFEASRIAREAGLERFALTVEAFAVRAKGGRKDIPAKQLYQAMRGSMTDEDIRAALRAVGYQVILDKQRQTTLLSDADALANMALERQSKVTPTNVSGVNAKAARLGDRSLGTDFPGHAGGPATADSEQADPNPPLHWLTFEEFARAGIVTYHDKEPAIGADGKPATNSFGSTTLRAPFFKLSVPSGTPAFADLPAQRLAPAARNAADPAEMRELAMRSYHKALVNHAATEGRYIPERVLQDYPDVAQHAASRIIDDPHLVKAKRPDARQRIWTQTPKIAARVGDRPMRSEPRSAAYSLGAEDISMEAGGISLPGGLFVARDGAGGAHLYRGRDEIAAFLEEGDAVGAGAAISQGLAEPDHAAAWAAVETGTGIGFEGDYGIANRPEVLGGGVNLFARDGSDRPVLIARAEKDSLARTFASVRDFQARGRTGEPVVAPVRAVLSLAEDSIGAERHGNLDSLPTPPHAFGGAGLRGPVLKLVAGEEPGGARRLRPHVAAADAAFAKAEESVDALHMLFPRMRFEIEADATVSTQRAKYRVRLDRVDGIHIGDFRKDAREFALARLVAGGAVDDPQWVRSSLAPAYREFDAVQPRPARAEALDLHFLGVSGPGQAEEARKMPAVFFLRSHDSWAVPTRSPFAAAAIERFGTTSPLPAAERDYIDVPFTDLDKVRAAGGKWDFRAKLWYVPEGTDPGPFAQWRTAESRASAAADRAELAAAQAVNEAWGRSYKERDATPEYPENTALNNAALRAPSDDNAADRIPPAAAKLSWHFGEGAFHAVGDVAEYSISTGVDGRARVEVREIGQAAEPAVLVETPRVVDALLVAEAFDRDEWDGRSLPRRELSDSARTALAASHGDVAAMRAARSDRNAALRALSDNESALRASGAAGTEVPDRLAKALEAAFKESGLRPVPLVAQGRHSDALIGFVAPDGRRATVLLQIGPAAGYFGVNEMLTDGNRLTGNAMLHGVHVSGQEAAAAREASRLAAERGTIGEPALSVRDQASVIPPKARAMNDVYRLPADDQPLIVVEERHRNKVMDALVRVSDDRLERLAQATYRHLRNGPPADRRGAATAASLIENEAGARNIDLAASRSVPAPAPPASAGERQQRGSPRAERQRSGRGRDEGR